MKWRQTETLVDIKRTNLPTSNCKAGKNLRILSIYNLFFCCSFLLYLRLFIMMGVTLIMESLTFTDPDGIVTLIFDIWNSLQGVLVFISFIPRRRVFRLIKKRLVLIYKIGENFTDRLMSKRYVLFNFRWCGLFRDNSIVSKESTSSTKIQNLSKITNWSTC